MDDLISRRDAIDALYKMLHDYFWADDKELDAVIMTLNGVPSAQSERKKGKWIDRAHYCVCNQCEHTEQQFNGVEPIPRHTPFCAMCGADMREEKIND